MKLKLTIALTCIIAILKTNAQIRLSSVSLSGGVTNITQANQGQQDVLKLFPTSLYFKDFTHDSMIKENNTGLMYSGTSGSFRISAGLQLNKSIRIKQELRIGVMNHTYSIQGGQTYRRDYRIDTLTSSQTGKQTFIDSSVYKTRNYTLSANNVMLDVAYVIHTNQDRRLAIFGGIGIRKSIGLNKTFESRTNEYSRNNYQNHYANYSNQNNFKSETLSVPSSFNYSLTQLYIPFGYQIRLSKRNYYLKHCYLNAEYSPSLSIENVNGTNKAYLDFGMFYGLKINF
jgi:hypothetical protein